VCLGASVSHAQPDPYKFKRIDINHGLSHNHVSSILKDENGFLWIGTNSGLNRFDGYSIKTFLNNERDSTTIAANSVSKLFRLPDKRIGVLTSGGLSIYNSYLEKFDANISTFYKRYRIPSGNIRDVIHDKHGHFWFLHSTSGLIRFDPSTGTVRHYRHAPGDTLTMASDVVSSFGQDSKGNRWILHSNGILEKIAMDENVFHVEKRKYDLHRQNKGILLNYQMYIDSDDDIWIYNQGQGVQFYDSKQDKFSHIHKDSPRTFLNNNLVGGVVQDNNGLIWIGTDHGGLNILDKKDFSVTHVLHRDEDEKSLAQNTITTMYKDDEGIIWIGSYKKGISYYHESIIRFPLYKHYPLSTSGLPYGDVNRFVEDDKNNLWIGTNGGGLLYYDRKTGRYKQFRHDPENENSLSSDVIVSLCLDHKNILWIGTYNGGLNSFDGKNFMRYTHDPADPASIGDENVWEVFEDSHQRLWIGTLSAGVDLLNRQTGEFAHYRSNDQNSVHSTYIAAITEDKEGNLWFGTSNGIDVLSRETGRFTHYENDKNDPESLSNNNVLDIIEDKKGRIWIGTIGGLNLFDQKSKIFRTFLDGDEPAHNTVLTILEDNTGNLWMGTPDGLSHMILNDTTDTLQVRFENFTEADGLQGKQFNENAAYKTESGEMIFGGANGFNIFKPEQLANAPFNPQVVLSDLQLYNRSVQPGEEIDGQVILPVSITVIKSITLPSTQNVFSLQFAALNYFHPEKNKYQYRLEGFNDQWLAADARSRTVTFTNIDPGTYTFRVRASNYDGLWNDEGLSLTITVLPPFYKTKIAFVLYILIVITCLLVTRKLIQKREKLKFAYEQERREALRVHEMDMMKLKFFTNVSHEFRTPLTLILTPMEKLIRQEKEPHYLNQFTLIQRNAKRLLNLVNQLLDFRKLEVQEIPFAPSEGDIIKFIGETVYSFSDLSEKKHIRFDFHTSLSSLETVFDQDKLEKVLFNLLSNAFKFTPENGSVIVDVNLAEEKPEGKWIRISVKDTGIGIASDKQEKIFERFFQNELPTSMVNQGSGIGLSITKEFVRIHGGTIDVESEPGKGTCFTVHLPIVEINAHNIQASQTSVMKPEGPGQEFTGPMEHANSRKPVLLLVEDNEDFRFYLKDNFKLDYTIIEARNGIEGWNQTLAHSPDLIISDVMMPEMNGIDLCRKIKSDNRFSHIPIILLTARTAEEQKLEGYETGADDYVTKPFNFEILASRIHNLIALRKKLHQSFPKQFDIHASEVNITSLDEKLISRAIRCVEENVSNADFSVEDLSHELGISRAHFYKKILALTGKSPLEFIRAIRLQRAAQLLEKSQLTVAEIAYQVGFNNPKYFARYFREEYHMLPSAFAASKRKS
jgi:signal transduction histidine kinase/ligand-binding sensor domain-containing protein/DNA-binding response OmpR family regulator